MIHCESKKFNPGKSVPGILAIVLAVSSAIWISFAIPNYLVDDAYISFRYAEHFASGKGLVYNLGEYVEGYTNFLWIIILALVRYLQVEIPVAARFLGFTFGLGGLFATLLLGTRLFEGKWRPLRWLPFLLLSTNRSYWLWAVSGMETTLFAFLVTLGMALAIGPRSTKYTVATAAVWFLATLTRPEGLMLFLIVCAWSFVVRKESTIIERVPPEAFLYFGMLAPYVAWKWYYFGAVIPNTFYAKNVGRLHLLTDGLDYTKAFVVDYGFGIGLFGVLAGLLKAPRGISVSKVRLLSSTLLAFILFVLSVGGDIYYHSRYFAPLFPLFYLVITSSGLMIGEFVSGGSTRRAIALTAVFSLFVHSAGIAMQEKRHLKSWSIDGRTMRLRTKLGLWLKESYPDSTVIATIAAGCIPYYSNLRNIDLAGLTNREIGRKQISTPGALAHEKFNTDYVLAQDPQLLEFALTENPIPLPWKSGMHLSFPEDFVKSFEQLAPLYPAQVDLLLTPVFHEKYQYTTFAIDPVTVMSTFVRLPAGAISQQVALRNLGWSNLERGLYDPGMSLLAQALSEKHGDPDLQRTIDRAFERFGANFDRVLWMSKIDKVHRESGSALQRQPGLSSHDEHLLSKP